MGKVFFDVGITIDGYIAGPNRRPDNPLGDGGLSIHDWMFKQKSFREHVGMEGGEENNNDNDIIGRIFNRIGANIMGRHMFEEGEANWPEEAPFHTPVYVLTQQRREPWERKGGTIFYFTNESLDLILKKAKKDAGEKDVRISGGASVIQQYLNAGFIDEFSIHIAPILMGEGIRLFENLRKDNFSFEIDNAVQSPDVTHIFYRVINNKR